MEELNTYQDVLKQIDEPGMSLFYLSRPSCGVCSAIKPKVEALSPVFPRLNFRYVNLDAVPEAAGQLSIFTIPAVLVYAEGKEVVREARYISMDSLNEKIRRPYMFIFGESSV